MSYDKHFVPYCLKLSYYCVLLLSTMCLYAALDRDCGKLTMWQLQTAVIFTPALRYRCHQRLHTCQPPQHPSTPVRLAHSDFLVYRRLRSLLTYCVLPAPVALWKLWCLQLGCLPSIAGLSRLRLHASGTPCQRRRRQLSR